MVKSSASMPEAVNHKSSSITVNKTNKLMDYFNALPAADCAQLLVSLRDFDPNVHLVLTVDSDTTFPHPTRSHDNYMSQVNTACNEDVNTQLYKEAKSKEAQQKAYLASKYGGKIPSHQLQSGLLISLVPWSDRGLNDAKIVLQKGDRGANPIACKKMHDKVVKALEPKTSAGNICRILTSVDASEYDVATDAVSWKSSLKLIKKFCIQYNMISLIKIPQDIDLAQPYQVARATLFKDAIDDWQVLNNAVYFNWQEFILQSGNENELESDNWLNDMLQMSLEKMLHAEVESDLCSLVPLS
jgi:hypothetical protein